MAVSPKTIRKSIVKSFKRFAADTSANVGLFFGLAAFPLMFAAGVAIDTVRAGQQQSSFYAAVDSAGFGLAQNPLVANYMSGSASQKAIDMAKIEALAEKWIASNYTPNAASGVKVGKPTIEISANDLKLNVDLEFPTSIMKLARIDSMKINADVTVAFAMRPVEVALVMDTTGSMSADIGSAKTAALQLLTKLYGGTDATSQYIRVALVPFSGAVRLDADDPAVLNWIDTTGANPLSTVNFDNSGAVKLNNYTAWAALKKPDGTNHKWNGCVEGRARNDADPTVNYLYNDAAPVDANTKFPAYFAPDGVSVDGQVTKSYKRPSDGSNRTATFYEPAQLNGTVTGTFTPDYIPSFYDVTIPLDVTNPIVSRRNRAIADTTTVYNDVSPNPQIRHTAIAPPATGTEVSGIGYNATMAQRFRNPAKYMGFVINPTASRGPWSNCTASEIVPLTYSRADVESGINAMAALGNTNIGEGVAWGMRVLSPGAPFDSVKGAGGVPGANSIIGPFKGPAWQKVMVLMSDGENNPYSGNSTSDLGAAYNSYGRSNVTTASGLNRYGTAVYGNLSTQMDNDTAKICQDLKDKGVTIYSTAFRDDSSLLQGCATEPNFPYYTKTNTGADLAAFFDHIGSSVRNKMIFVSK